MSEQNTTETAAAPEAEETVTEDTATDETTAPEAGDATAAELETIPRQDAWDPQRALAKIRKLNAEVTKAKAEIEESKTVAEEAKTLRRQVTLEKVARRLELGDNEDTDEFLSRLRGETVEECMQDAERLLTLASARKPEPATPATRKPVEALRGGGSPEREPEETDVRKLAARMFSH